MKINKKNLKKHWSGVWRREVAQITQWGHDTAIVENALEFGKFNGILCSLEHAHNYEYK